MDGGLGGAAASGPVRPEALGVADHVSITRSGGGAEETFVVSNDASGNAFLTNRQTVDFLDQMREGLSAPMAAQAVGFDEQQATHLIQSLVAHGLLTAPGRTQPAPKPKRPVESRLIFFRIGLFDAKPIAKRCLPLLERLFSPFAVLVWLGLIVAAAVNLIAEPEAFRHALTSLLDLSWTGAVQLAIVFIILKIFHELGHALALMKFAREEGVPVGAIPAGVSIFALFPFPYTDATAAWKIRSRFRRAMIGLAGVYFESWIAAFAALAWAYLKPGELQTVLFQVLLISGMSTFLFNMNPLVRLDGYFVYSDLARRPNLATRAQLNARSVGQWLLGADLQPVSSYHLTYWALSYAYRWVIFAGIFWGAYVIDPRLSWIVAAIALMILVVRPVMSVVKDVWGKSHHKLRAMGTVGIAAALGFALFLPVPDTVHIEAHIVGHEAEVVRVKEPVLLRSVGAPSVGDGASPVLDMQSPDLDLELAVLEIDKLVLNSSVRAASGRNAASLVLMTTERDRVEAQLEQAQTRLAALSVIPDRGTVWEPAEALRAEGVWLSTAQNQILGMVSRPVPHFLRGHLDQAYAEFGTALKDGHTIEFRPIADPACTGTASVETFAPVSDLEGGGFTVEARPVGTDCTDKLSAGAGVVLRLSRPDASIVTQLYQSASRLALNRLPRDLSPGR